MAKLIHATTLEGFKSAYQNWASSTNNDAYHSIALTDDGYLYTHGLVFKISKVSDTTNPYNLALAYSTGSLSVTVGDTTKSVTLPVWKLTGDTYITATDASGSWTINHKTLFTEAQTAGPSATSNTTINIPKIVTDIAGHITSLSEFSATLNNVLQSADSASTTNKTLLFGSGSNGTAAVGYNSNIYVVPNTGELHATTLFEGTTSLTNKYVSISTYNTHTASHATSSVYGHVILSDSINGTANATSGATAATPLAVKNAYDAAIAEALAEAKTLLGNTDAMHFVGTVNGTGIIQSHNSTIYTSGITDGTTNLSGLTSYNAGDTWKVTAAGTITGIGTVESGDMIICIKDITSSTYSASDWTVVQANIDGSLISTSNLTGIIYGTGSRTLFGSGSLGTSGYILQSAGDGNAPTWVVPNTLWRDIKINDTSISTNVLNLKNSTGILFSVNNGELTISTDAIRSIGKLTFSDGTNTLLYNPPTETTITLGRGLNISSSAIGHSNSTTARATSAVYATTIDAYGHITGSTAQNPLTIKIASGTTEGTSLYYGYSATSRTLNITAGSNITLTPTAGALSISSTNTVSRLYIGATNVASNAATSNGNTYIKLANSGSIVDNLKVYGSGSVTVSSDTNGNLLITGVDNNTWRNITAYLLTNNTSSEILSSTVGTADLDFGSEFLWDATGGSGDGQLHLGWAEVDSTGAITYTI